MCVQSQINVKINGSFKREPKVIYFCGLMEQFREKIETYGSFYEKQGFSPVASRIMIYLFLHPEGEATFDELLRYFGVSKSAVSNGLRVLLHMEVITERTLEGGRKRYFRAAVGHMFSPGIAIKAYRESRLIFEDIRALRGKEDAIAGELLKVTSFIKILETEYADLYEKMLKGLLENK